MTNPTTTTRRVRTMLEMFVDATTGESYQDNRLITEETERDTVALTAYGWQKIAEYDESEQEVTLFFGHKNTESVTVSRWLNRLLDVARERGRSVTISHESPNIRKPADSAQYIGNYISGYDDMSAVEEQAFDHVVKSLSFLNDIV